VVEPQHRRAGAGHHSSPQFNGILGQGDTRPLLGGSFGDTFHVGGRVGVGHWFDDNGCRGVEARLFWVAPSTATFSGPTRLPAAGAAFINVTRT